MTKYWDLPGFEYLYLEDSWVTGIRATPGELAIEADLVLREQHPAYSHPKPGEQYCYHAGTVRFFGVSALKWSGQGRPPAVDGTGEYDYGSIDSLLQRDNVFMLTGDFGEIEVVVAALPEVDLH